MSDLTTPEGRLDILNRETFPWSPEASTMACQTIRSLLAEPTDAQVEAAAEAFHDAELHRGAWEDYDCWTVNTDRMHEVYRERARAALKAAAEARG